jgi:hypothetical protein
MIGIWLIAAGTLAAAATALILRRGRRSEDGSQSSQASTTPVGTVSEEWLSNARGQGDQTW